MNMINGHEGRICTKHVYLVHYVLIKANTILLIQESAAGVK